MLGRPWTLLAIVDTLANARVDLMHADVEITGVTTDSRAVRAGDLFVAIRGETFDGHEFVHAAHRAGAAAALVDDRTPPPTDVPCIVVEDTRRALGDFASAVLRDRGIIPIAITGSCGKTTAKDLTAAVMATAGPVGATLGNFNNDIGVPLSIFALPDPCTYAVLEVATSGPGEIERLSTIVQPTVGVITNVAAAHLEGLGSVAGVRDAKAELLAGLRKDGTLVLNADDATTPEIRSRWVGRVVTFGTDAAADVRATDVTMNARHHAEFRVNGDWPVELGLYGHAAVKNALVAVAVGLEFGLAPDAIASALRAVQPARMRMEIRDVRGVSVINDAYNANPRSMVEALRAFENGHFRGRKIAVLGDMLELGAEADALHEELGRRVAAVHADLLYVLGERAAHVRAGALAAGMQAERVYTPASHDEIVQSLRYALQPGDVVLVKGSRGMRMERVADALLEDGAGT